MESVLQLNVRNVFILCAATVFLSGTTARTVEIQNSNDENNLSLLFSRNRKNQDWVQEKDCEVHKMEHIHLVMDRVCEMCHEMFSHQHSSLRAECRSNCFDNEWFRRCLTLFSEPKKTSESDKKTD